MLKFKQYLQEILLKPGENGFSRKARRYNHLDNNFKYWTNHFGHPQHYERDSDLHIHHWIHPNVTIEKAHEIMHNETGEYEENKNMDGTITREYAPIGLITFHPKTQKVHKITVMDIHGRDED